VLYKNKHAPFYGEAQSVRSRGCSGNDSSFKTTPMLLDTIVTLEYNPREGVALGYRVDLSTVS